MSLGEDPNWSSGYNLWKNVLNSAKLIVAPMVDQSELAWRLLSRRYGAQLCYTPMINANIFVNDVKYRKLNLVTTAQDRPLIVQFCANDSDILVEACRIAYPYCDAIDLNLGCPQAIAKRGHYGAYLMDNDWQLIYRMINRVTNELKIPITCKIRVFAEIEKTVEYAKMLESAGVSIICVHGRRREQKGPMTGLASWHHIKAVKDAVKIPVFANGNIQYFEDIEKCFNETGVDGIMTAEGNLHNPAIFTKQNVPVWTIAEQYLELVKKYECPISFIRGHIFKIFHHCFMLPSNEDLREEVAKARTILEFDNVTVELKNRYLQKYAIDCDKLSSPLPPYICQPYFRPQPNSTEPSVKDCKRLSDDDSAQPIISKRKLKRLNRNKIRTVKENKRGICSLCPNPKGLKCEHNLCKSCCRKKTYFEILDCIGHKFQIKTRNENYKKVSH